MAIAFLPTDYEAPKGAGNFMKLADGENKIRILTQPILGWEDWTAEKKPIRFRLDAKPAKPINAEKPIKHFWAMAVWNYGDEKIQILQITQAGIRKPLENLCKDADWGAPFFYDIKISRKGEGINTEYNVTPLSHKPAAAHIKDAFDKLPIWLDALFTNADPFAPSDSRTAGVFSEQAQIPQAPVVSDKASPELIAWIEQRIPHASQKYQENIEEYFKRTNVTFATMTSTMATSIKNSMIKQGLEDAGLPRMAIEDQLESAGF